MSESRYMRQSGLVDSSIFDTPICMIGAGGIGSFTALALAKIGFKNITVWDMDRIEEHNLPNQFYPLSCIGDSKVNALYDILQTWTGVTILTYGEWTKEEELYGVVIMAVDSMRVRKEIYDSVKRSTDVIAVVDGRMGGNQLEVYTCDIKNGEDKKAYKKTLWSDAQTSPLPCTQRAVMYNVLNIASWIVNQVRLVLSKKEYKRTLIMDLENMILIS